MSIESSPAALAKELRACGLAVLVLTVGLVLFQNQVGACGGWRAVVAVSVPVLAAAVLYGLLGAMAKYVQDGDATRLAQAAASAYRLLVLSCFTWLIVILLVMVEYYREAFGVLLHAAPPSVSDKP